MTTEDLLKRLDNVQGIEMLPEASDEVKERFFIFSVGESLYALNPASIHEIVSSLEVFPIPACPPYIPGLINCHGIPHTVFDLRVLFSNERQFTDQFLILNLENDAVAFGCTEVKEILEIQTSKISKFAEKETDTIFFSGIIETEEDKIPILSIKHILRKLENDLG